MAANKKKWIKPQVVVIARGKVNSGTHHNAINEGTLIHGVSPSGSPTVHTPGGHPYPSVIYTFVS